MSALMSSSLCNGNGWFCALFGEAAEFGKKRTLSRPVERVASPYATYTLSAGRHVYVYRLFEKDREVNKKLTHPRFDSCQEPP